jgi:hypothetical protein
MNVSDAEVIALQKLESQIKLHYCIGENVPSRFYNFNADEYHIFLLKNLTIWESAVAAMWLSTKLMEASVTGAFMVSETVVNISADKLINPSTPRVKAFFQNALPELFTQFYTVHAPQ